MREKKRESLAACMTEKRKRQIVWLLFFATVAFIWINSLLPTQVSVSASNGTKQALQAPLPQDSFLSRVLQVYIRKLAHLLEYALLGAELLLLRAVARTRRHAGLWEMTVGLWVAVADESFQILSGRGPMIEDVLLDMTGVLSGWLLAAFGVWLIRCVRHRTRARRRGQADGIR